MIRHPTPLAAPLSAALLFAIIGLWPFPLGAQQVTAKKLIYYGWGVRDTQYVRDHWPEMEQMPFDGTAISVAIDRSLPTVGDGVTSNLLEWQVMGRRSFRVAEFREAIADLKAAKWRTFTDNFLSIALSSQYAEGLNWFDNAHWRIVANNFAVVARIAVEGGLKGLILDPEDYGYELFSYRRQGRSVNKTFKEYKSMARQRGRELMATIADGFPNAVIFSLLGHSSTPLMMAGENLPLEQSRYALLASFWDGLLEAMPSGGRLIDGYEWAYPFKRRAQFLEAYNQMRGQRGAITFSAVPNHYRAKLEAGFGLWLDYNKKADYFSSEEFRRAVSEALEVSDRYVWIYTQGPRFFPPAGIDPAYIEALAAARRGVRQ